MILWTLEEFTLKQYTQLIMEENEMEMDVAEKLVRVMGIMYTSGFQPYYFDEYLYLASMVQDLSDDFKKTEDSDWIEITQKIQEYVDADARRIFESTQKQYNEMMEVIRHSVT